MPPFTGRIGTQNSLPGDIVLGIVDAFELATIGFRVHVLSSTEVRARFDKPVTDSALTLAAYNITAVTPGAAVPSLASVDFYDADRLSVVVRTSLPLTSGATYSLQVVGVQDFNGQGVSSSSVNFTANVPDPPRVIGAYQSRRGAVDLVFDRPVGPTSSAPTATIRGETGSPVPMIQTVWASESIPEDTVRFIYPGTTPISPSFLIDFSGVVDASNNVGSGTVPLTLALRGAPPYNASSLSQMQFVDAYVSEITGVVDAATVRVYFNCPALASDVVDAARWQVTQSGPHVVPDTINPILVPDAVTLTDAVNFLNAVADTLNDHVQEAPAHLGVDPSLRVTQAPCDDLSTAIVLYDDIRAVFAKHTSGAGAKFHLYAEPAQVPALSAPTVPALVSGVNSLKALYNQHLAADRDLPFTSVFPDPILTITDRASLDRSFPVRSQLTYFADLHVVTRVSDMPVRVRGTIRSEDGGSSTSTLNFSGDVTARAASAAAKELSVEPVPDQAVHVVYDKEIDIPELATVVVRNGMGSLPIDGVTVLSSLPEAVWFYNSLVFCYSQHIGTQPQGAGHIGPESQFFVISTDYAVTTSLSEVISCANNFKIKYNGHVRNLSAHTNRDATIRAADATDFSSLIALLADMRASFVSHNGSGDSANPTGLAPTSPGHHTFPGLRFLATPLFTQLRVSFRNPLDLAAHTVSFDGMTVVQGATGPREAPFRSSVLFTAVASRPSLASVLPRSGLTLREDREGKTYYNFESDSLEVYFSKRMHRVALNGGTGSSISVTGGPIILKGADWVDERTASVRVTQMEQIPYTLTASGLVDLAGNPLT